MRKLMFLLSLSCLIGETAFEQESASETCTRRFHYGLDFSFSQKPDLDVSGGAWFKVLKQEAAVLLGVKQHKGKGVAIVEGKERELSTVTAFGTLLAEFKVFTFGKRLPKKGDDAFMGKILVVPYVSTNAVDYCETGVKAEYLMNGVWGWDIGINTNSDRRFARGFTWSAGISVVL